jgi:hypothetical protein
VGRQTVATGASVERPERPQGPPRPIVWTVGAEHWPRALLRAELIERGWDAIGFASLPDALAQLVLERARRSAGAPPSVMAIDLRAQRVTDRQLDALFLAGVPLVAVGGASEWGDERLAARTWSARLRRPVTLGAIADTIALVARARRSGVPPHLAP